MSSEVSEEDLELLSKTISLSGFDDNVSPCNHVNVLLRFGIGEVFSMLPVFSFLILFTYYYFTCDNTVKHLAIRSFGNHTLWERRTLFKFEITRLVS